VGFQREILKLFDEQRSKNQPVQDDSVDGIDLEFLSVKEPPPTGKKLR
jgi:hypothetical protein